MQIIATVSDHELDDAVSSTSIPDPYGCKAKRSIFKLYESKGLKMRKVLAGDIRFEGKVTLDYNHSDMTTTITQEIDLK